METSTMSKSLFSRHDRAAFLEHEVPEESSWTMYFQDFCNNNNNNVDNQESQDRFCYDNSSLISDAASFAGAAAKIVRKTSGSKKRRTFDGTRNFVGNDLEDTASSPSNSPKVFSVADEHNGNRTEEDMQGMKNQEKERMEVGLEGDGELTELKKKGLCLVPLSMLTNYIA